MFAYVRKLLYLGFSEENDGHDARGFLEKYQVCTAYIVVLMPAVGLLTVWLLAPTIAAYGSLILLYTSPLWVLIPLKKSVKYYWMHYIQHQFLENPRQAGVLLEVKLSRNIQKSPRAMELVFESLIKPSVTTPFQVQWRGHVRPWWSFEIRSKAGEIHFYIWTWKRMRQRIENTIYAQYPDVQIVEVEDYAKDVRFVPGKNEVMGEIYGYGKSDAHPIKTYYDFGLEKDPKTEYKVDPLVSMLELFSQIKTGEIWLQYVVQNAVDVPGWKARVEKEVQLVYDKASPEWADPSDPEKTTKGSAILRPMQYEYIKAMQRAMMRTVLDVGIRVVYVTPPDGMKLGVVHQLFNMYKMVGSPGGEYYNMLGPSGDSYLANFDYPWEDFQDIRANYLRRKLLEAYRTRSFFYPPIIDDAIIMTTEQLATLYHFPGEESQALGLERLESTRAAPPIDLPV